MILLELILDTLLKHLHWIVVNCAIYSWFFYVICILTKTKHKRLTLLSVYTFDYLKWHHSCLSRNKINIIYIVIKIFNCNTCINNYVLDNWRDICVDLVHDQVQCRVSYANVQCLLKKTKTSLNFWLYFAHKTLERSFVSHKTILRHNDTLTLHNSTGHNEW